jgi:hypothetical protein
LNSTQTIKLLALYCMTPAISFAQDAWQFGSSVTAMTGHYADSLTMNNQHGVGVRMSGEKDKKCRTAIYPH